MHPQTQGTGGLKGLLAFMYAHPPACAWAVRMHTCKCCCAMFCINQSLVSTTMLHGSHPMTHHCVVADDTLAKPTYTTHPEAIDRDWPEEPLIRVLLLLRLKAPRALGFHSWSHFGLPRWSP
mmetsp:Transcript_46443/g.75593  ORF Transcript_46443/g.75593 Transcript_46443/m.75593 type:complete len:122 (-) Transcript_46443:932-1297(-)